MSHSTTEDAPRGGPAGRPYTYRNRLGVRYYIRALRDRCGRRTLVMTKSADLALPAKPPGYEVRENVHGQVSIRRKRPSPILVQEEALVRNCVAKLKPFAHACDVEGRCITIYASARDRKCLAGSLDADFAEGFASVLDDALGQRYGGELVRMFKANRRDRSERPGRFYPLLRFRLKDPRRRIFCVERVCFTGDKAWLALGAMSLPAALTKYIPHLGRDTFFDLI